MSGRVRGSALSDTGRKNVCFAAHEGISTKKAGKCGS